MIGEIIAHYRILEKLGEGGMGVVYKAHDTKLKRDVALKFLPIQLTTDKTEMGSFFQEARAASAINHPNVCVIYDILDEFKSPFIVMEYIEGKTVRKKITENLPQLLTLPEVIDYAIQIAEALQTAHQRGIIHRDIKSDNIMITSTGQIKVMDFGLAEIKGMTHVTKTLSSAGTVAFMSPEQIWGGKVDHRTDIWSMGVVWYELLTGQLPFQGEYEQEVIYSILKEEPKSLKSCREGVPAPLEKMVNRALSKNPDQRHQKVSDILNDLISIGRTMEKTPVDFISHKIYNLLNKPVLFYSILLSLILIIVLSLYFIFLNPSTSNSKKAIVVLPFENLNGNPEYEFFCDGVTEDIRVRLGKISGLRVISRTSVLKYKERPRSIKEIAGELKVGAILEGSIRWNEEGIRVVVQLFDALTEATIWGETFDRDFGDVFEIQSEVAGKIALALLSELTDTERSYLQEKPTTDPMAYQFYLRGREYYFRYNTKGATYAIELFKKAIELDPNYAIAYADLAKAYILKEALGSSPTLMDSAFITSQRSLALDSECSEAYCSMGMVYRHKGSYSAAIEMFKKSLDLNPNNWMAVYNLGELKNTSGLFHEALLHLQNAILINPADPYNYKEIAITYKELGNFQEAEYCSKKALELQPDFASAYDELASVNLRQEKWADAITYYKEAIQLDSSDQWVHHDLAVTYQNYNKYNEAITEYEKAIKINPNNQWHYIGLAGVYIVLAQYDQAMYVYQRALDFMGEKSYLCLHYAFVLSRVGRLDDARAIVEKVVKARDDTSFDLNGKIAQFYLGLLKPQEIEQAFYQSEQVKYKHFRNFKSIYYCLAMAFSLNLKNDSEESPRDTAKAVYYLKKYLNEGGKDDVEYPVARAELRRLGVQY
jgi:serine/threonine protein kinase/tetratricopeptide (TPR) repeat protein